MRRRDTGTPAPARRCGHERTRRLPVGSCLCRSEGITAAGLRVCLRSVEAVRALTAVPKYPDVYVSEDADTVVIRSLLERGFRWIRTEGELAVFEKEVPR